MVQLDDANLSGHEGDLTAQQICPEGGQGAVIRTVQSRWTEDESSTSLDNNYQGPAEATR